MSEETATITLRPASADDENFLYHVYQSTRAEELAAWGWDAGQQEMFLRMQFNAQRMSYGLGDEETEGQIILLEGQPIGQIIVARGDKEISLVDISLLTEYRSKGIGATLIQALFDEATRAGKIISLHVLKSNRARRLYERLGFQTTGESGMHFEMKWGPA